MKTGPEYKGILFDNPQQSRRILQPFHEYVRNFCFAVKGVEGMQRLTPEEVYSYEFGVIWGGDRSLQTYMRLFHQGMERTGKKKDSVVVLQDLGTTNTGMLQAIKQIISGRSVSIPEEYQKFFPPDQYQATMVNPVFLNGQAITYLVGAGWVEVNSQEYVDKQKAHGSSQEEVRRLYQKGAMDALLKLFYRYPNLLLQTGYETVLYTDDKAIQASSYCCPVMCLGMGGEILANFPFVLELDPKKIRYIGINGSSRYTAAMRCLAVLGLGSLGYGGPDLAAKLGLVDVKDVDRMEIIWHTPVFKVNIDGDVYGQNMLQTFYTSFAEGPKEENFGRALIYRGEFPLIVIVPQYYINREKRKLQPRDGILYSRIEKSKT